MFNEEQSDFITNTSCGGCWQSIIKLDSSRSTEKCTLQGRNLWKIKETHSLNADEHILHEQLFNCDKSCLSSKILLSQSLADHEGKSADDYTRSKEKCDNFCLPGND